MRPNRLEGVCVELKRRHQPRGEAENRTPTNQILHARMTRLIDTLHKLQYVVGKAVNDGHANVIIVLILPICQSIYSFQCDFELTEYEFSESSEEPVARTFGE